MNRILELRKQKKINQTDLANFVGCSQRNISYYENEERKIPPEVLAKLCAAFDVTADYLLGLADENIKAPPQTRGEANMDFGSNAIDSAQFQRLREANNLFLRLDEVGKAQALAYLQFLSAQQSRELDAQD